MKRVRIAGDTFYYPGITNVCLYRDCMVDPGNNENLDWDNPPYVRTAVISHMHTDHFWNGAKIRAHGGRIYAPRHERSAIEDTAVNTNGNFCWAVPPESMLPWFFTKLSCPVDGTLDEMDSLLTVFPLPGHTQWQCGFVTPDRVLIAADAIVTKKVWDTKKIVYYTSISDARRSLQSIIDADVDWVLPSHCELLSKERAIELAEVNLTGIDKLEEIVRSRLGREELTTEEMVSRVAMELKMREDFNMHIVAETTVRSFLYMLCGRGDVGYELRDHKVYWKALG